jgi:hypothetical protein
MMKHICPETDSCSINQHILYYVWKLDYSLQNKKRVHFSNQINPLRITHPISLRHFKYYIPMCPFLFQVLISVKVCRLNYIHFASFPCFLRASTTRIRDFLRYDIYFH